MVGVWGREDCERMLGDNILHTDSNSDERWFVLFLEDGDALVFGHVFSCGVVVCCVFCFVLFRLDAFCA